jgi:hypothetical protein
MYWRQPVKENHEITPEEFQAIRNAVFSLHGFLAGCYEDKTMMFFYPQISDTFKYWNNCVTSVFIKDEYKEAGKIK